MSKPIKIISIRKMRWMLFLLGFFKIPLVGFIKPKLISIDENKVCVKIKLRRRTKNHLNSMYFGALAVGADIAGGIHVFYFAELSNLKVSFAFKGMKADFIKRAESDILFESNQGEIVRNAINLSAETGERVNETINVIALDQNQEIVATFEMIVSVKVAPSMS
jgi:acyl-coenzyme A thioesterase PaaI-like protein